MEVEVLASCVAGPSGADGTPRRGDSPSEPVLHSGARAFVGAGFVPGDGLPLRVEFICPRRRRSPSCRPPLMSATRVGAPLKRPLVRARGRPLASGSDVRTRAGSWRRSLPSGDGRPPPGRRRRPLRRGGGPGREAG